MSVASAAVEYFRGDNCGHVWTHEKNNPDSPAKPDMPKEPSVA